MIIALSLALALTPSDLARPAAPSAIQDVAQRWSQREEDHLYEQISQVRAADDVLAAILTVPDTSGQNAHAFATEVFNRWGVGRGGENNGVLLAISMDPRRLEVVTGTGVRTMFPDVWVTEIRRANTDTWTGLDTDSPLGIGSSDSGSCDSGSSDGGGGGGGDSF